jgi:hypothetical protein
MRKNMNLKDNFFLIQGNYSKHDNKRYTMLCNAMQIHER